MVQEILNFRPELCEHCIMMYENLMLSKDWIWSITTNKHIKQTFHSCFWIKIALLWLCLRSKWPDPFHTSILGSDCGRPTSTSFFSFLSLAFSVLVCQTSTWNQVRFTGKKCLNHQDNFYVTTAQQFRRATLASWISTIILLSRNTYRTIMQTTAISTSTHGPCGVTTGWSDASSAVVKCRVDAFYSSSLSASAVG
jgi:hypothetical protein